MVAWGLPLWHRRARPGPASPTASAWGLQVGIFPRRPPPLSRPSPPTPRPLPPTELGSGEGWRPEVPGDRDATRVRANLTPGRARPERAGADPVPPGRVRPPSRPRRQPRAWRLAHTPACAGQPTHLGHAGLQQQVVDQLPVGLVVGEQLLQAGEEPALLQVETVGRGGDAVVAHAGRGPDCGCAELKAFSCLLPAPRPPTTPTRWLPKPSQAGRGSGLTDLMERRECGQPQARGTARGTGGLLATGRTEPGGRSVDTRTSPRVSG